MFSVIQIQMFQGGSRSACPSLLCLQRANDTVASPGKSFTESPTKTRKARPLTLWQKIQNQLRYHILCPKNFRLYEKKLRNKHPSPFSDPHWYMTSSLHIFLLTVNSISEISIDLPCIFHMFFWINLCFEEDRVKVYAARHKYPLYCF